MQGFLFTESQPSVVLWQGCEFRLQCDFLSGEEADELMRALRSLPGWRQDEIRIYGKAIPLPRLHCWFADDRQPYSWSGIKMKAEKFPSQLHSLRQRVEQESGARFNTALANFYRDGRDSVAWHADDEAELGTHPIISSLSLGGTRRFVLRDKLNHQKKLSFELSHGSLLTMCGNTQRICEHCVPKQRVADARINVTFRRMDAAQPVR